jgi:putative oxygen-independent coproporphyrinogen III oxidase
LNPPPALPLPLGLYIHLPWCVRKCPYCDFNSHHSPAVLPEQAYLSALLAELARYEEAYSYRPLESIFFGGGTPSLFSAGFVQQVLDTVARRWNLAEDIEITLEANPGTVEAGKFLGFRQAGVNRLSIGIQSFDAISLVRLGRIHGREQALSAVDTAISAGFSNFNLDLMFGLPGQSLTQGLADLNTALSLSPPHLSWYQLTLEPNTLFHKYPPQLPEDEAIWFLQQDGLARLAQAGYEQYEVSAHARDGFRSRHNLNYWQFGDYIGIGAGAHGKLTDPATGTITRTRTIRHPEHYLACSEQQPERLIQTEEVPVAQRTAEFLMNHLRLRQGFDLNRYQTRTGLPESTLEPGLATCIADGLLKREGSSIRCTSQGWNFLDDVLQRFL